MKECLVTPLGALSRGLVAGAAGALAQNVFFKATAKIAPETPKGVFSPPEPEQHEETPTQTVARRFVEQFTKQGSLTAEQHGQSAQVVHVLFGAGWGGVYALLRESFPVLGTPPAIAAYSVGVWHASDNLLLPAFRLAAPASAYPLRTHAYAVSAHLAYGFAVAGVYGALRMPVWRLAAGALASLAVRRAIGGARHRRSGIARALSLSGSVVREATLH